MTHFCAEIRVVCSEGRPHQHIGIDRIHGLIRTWDASAANAHDGARLPDVVSRDNTGSGVWADTAYRSKKNEAFLAKGMFTSHIHQNKPPRRPMPERIARAMQNDLPCARRSSTCLLGRNTAWASSCGPSASPAPASRSTWRTSPITSNASPGLTGALRLRDRKTGVSSRLHSENHPIKADKASFPRPPLDLAASSDRKRPVLRGAQLIAAMPELGSVHCRLADPLVGLPHIGQCRDNIARIVQNDHDVWLNAPGNPEGARP